MADLPKFDLLTTPDPNESVVAVTCEVDNLRLAQMPIAYVTTYAQFEAGDRCRVDEFGSYIFTMKSKQGHGLLTYHFAKSKTETEKYTPYLTELKQDPSFYWPNVMERWRAEPDPTRATEGNDPNGGTSYDMKWNAIFTMKPYVQGATQIERLWYLAPTKFELQKPVIMQPVSFGWDLPGDGMEPTRMLIAQRIRRPNTVVGPVPVSVTKFEPTVPSGWVRHLTGTDQTQLETGLWQMWEDYALPPNQVNTIRDK